MLASLGLGGDAAAGIDENDPDALQGLLEGMMGQLVTKEVLEAPLKELTENVSLCSRSLTTVQNVPGLPSCRLPR